MSDVLEVPASLQSGVPRLAVDSGISGKIKVFNNFESSISESLDNFTVVDEVGKRVTFFDVSLDLLVVGIGGVVLVSCGPFIASKHSSRLKNLVDLLKDLDTLRSMASSFNRIGRIKRSFGILEVHKVALLSLTEVIQVGLLIALISSLDLVIIVIDSNHLSSRESSNTSHRSSNTTAKVNAFHTRLETKLESEPMLMSGDRSMEVLTLEGWGKVEALSPSVLVKVCDEVVVVVDHQRILGLALVNLLLVLRVESDVLLDSFGHLIAGAV
jgi:hypothetical protein